MTDLNSDRTFHFEILRALAHASSGGADVAEVLATASEIVPGDFESYYSAWNKRAERVLAQASKMTNPVSIRKAMFRASTYFRSADFFIHGNWDDPRIMTLWEKQTKCFDQAMANLPIPGYRKSLPASGFEVPIIFFPASKDENEKRPTIIMGNGYDGSMEEMYHNYGVAALERGWNVVCYDGPGQPNVRRYQGLGFTHEWEKVVSPVIDFVEKLPCVDATKLGLIGNSMAGLLAARAAAFDHRIAAVFSIDGLYNFMETPVFSPSNNLKKFADAKTFAQTQAIYNDPNMPTMLRWALSHGLWCFKVQTPEEYLEKAKGFSLVGLADKIECPVFVGDAQDDLFFKGQPEAMAAALGDKATRVVFTAADAAAEHCHEGAWVFCNQVMYDWFEEKIVNDKSRVTQ